MLEPRKPRTKASTILRVCLFAVVGAGVAFGAVVAGLVAIPIVQDYRHRTDFVAEVWRTSEDGDDLWWPQRLRMVDDLLSQGKLIGMSREQVVELLGPPAPPGFPCGAKDAELHYHLGPERGFVRIDSEWLMLGVDGSGLVDRAWLYQD